MVLSTHAVAVAVDTVKVGTVKVAKVRSRGTPEVEITHFRYSMRVLPFGLLSSTAARTTWPTAKSRNCSSNRTEPVGGNSGYDTTPIVNREGPISYSALAFRRGGLGVFFSVAVGASVAAGSSSEASAVTPVSVLCATYSLLPFRNLCQESLIGFKRPAS